MLNGGAVVGIGAVGGCCGGFVGDGGGGTGGSSVGKGVIGAGVPGRSTPGVGANVLFVPAETSAADATMVINFIIIVSLLF